VAHPDDNGAGCDVGAAGNGGRTTVGAGAESLRQAHGPCGASRPDARSTSGGGFWSDAVWLNGSDGKARRSQPGLPLLAHGVPGRVGKLRAYGNAIVPPLAAEVVKALMETLDV
jgi:DNA (cytosine-5)-methyltransferase 1